MSVDFAHLSILAADGLVWWTPEVPKEAAGCPTEWCDGIHDGIHDGGEEHWKDIARATRDGHVVLEVSVSQYVRTGQWSLDSGRKIERMPRRAYIVVWLYNADGVAYRAVHFNQADEAHSLGFLLRALGQYEFAGALATAVDLVRTLDRGIPR